MVVQTLEQPAPDSEKLTLHERLKIVPDAKRENQPFDEDEAVELGQLLFGKVRNF